VTEDHEVSAAAPFVLRHDAGAGGLAGWRSLGWSARPTEASVAFPPNCDIGLAFMACGIDGGCFDGRHTGTAVAKFDDERDILRPLLR
jgi:hypothetical protein